MNPNSLLFIGIRGAVLALDRTTGEEIWRTDLRASDFTNVVWLDGDVFAATQGELYCLDPITGEVRWHNPLKGLGRGLITIAAPGGQSDAVARQKKRKDDDAAAASITTG